MLLLSYGTFVAERRDLPLDCYTFCINLFSKVLERGAYQLFWRYLNTVTDQIFRAKVEMIECSGSVGM